MLGATEPTLVNASLRRHRSFSSPATVPGWNSVGRAATVASLTSFGSAHRFLASGAWAERRRL